MKNFVLLVLVGLAGISQTGCWGWLSGKTNTVTTHTYYRPDGTVQQTLVTEEMSNDAAYYQSVAKSNIAYAEAVKCPECSDLGRVALALAVNTRKKFPPRAKNGYELAKDGFDTALGMSPWGAVTVLGYKAFDTPRNINVGENAVYAPLDNDMVGSDSGSMNIPYRYGTSEEIFEPALVEVE